MTDQTTNGQSLIMELREDMQAIETYFQNKDGNKAKKACQECLKNVLKIAIDIDQLSTRQQQNWIRVVIYEIEPTGIASFITQKDMDPNGCLTVSLPQNVFKVLLKFKENVTGQPVSVPCKVLVEGNNAGRMQVDIVVPGTPETSYVYFNKTHKDSLPKPKGRGPNDGRLQSHHGLQQQWAKENLAEYGYDADLAPSITLETGGGHPHTAISNLQNARRNARVDAGEGKWSSSLQDELQNIVDDMGSVGFQKKTIDQVLEQQYQMLDKLNIPYEKLNN